MLLSNNNLTIRTLLGYLSTFSMLLLILLLNYHRLFVHTHTICHEKHTANIKSEISEHGAFPLVSVWVQHGEPGNVHPYNFEPISPAKTFFWAKLL